MSDYLIVTRHPAAVEFIRSRMTEFQTAPVVEAATPDDVRGKVVAGNLPLHLASLAAQVIAVEFPAAPPRGQEYTSADMIAAGATLRRYTVAAVPEPPVEVRWSDGIGHRGRHTRLIVGRGDVIALFAGATVPGIAAVAASSYNKNGKWSSTAYTLLLAPGSWSLSMTQDFENGRYFHTCRTVADAVAALRSAGCTAPDAAAVAFLESVFAKTVARLRQTEADIASVK